MEPMNPDVREFFHEATYTYSYVVTEPGGKHCVIIDSVMDYDPKSGRLGSAAADALIEHVQERGLSVDWILETHVHADHVTAAPYLRDRLGGRIAIGAKISEVQAIFKKLFNAEADFRTDGSQFDKLLEDGDELRAGELRIHAMHTPGHTPACMTYVIGDAAFVGDTIFMPDFGTARADFPGGDAATLYRSTQKVLSLPPETRLFMCHDYAPGGRDYAFQTTVAEERARNIHVHEGVSEADFVKMRSERDAKLDTPTLLLPSIQINMRAGDLPPAEDNGVRYIKVPLNQL